VKRCYCAHPDAAAATCRGCPLAGLLSPDLCFVAYLVTCAVMGHTLVAALKRHARANSGDWQTRAIISVYTARTRTSLPCPGMYVCMYVCMHACMYVCMCGRRGLDKRQKIGGASSRKNCQLARTPRNLTCYIHVRETWSVGVSAGGLQASVCAQLPLYTCPHTTIYVSAYHCIRACCLQHTAYLKRERKRWRSSRERLCSLLLYTCPHATGYARPLYHTLYYCRPGARARAVAVVKRAALVLASPVIVIAAVSVAIRSLR
jgi:hypothetical protein